MAFSLDELQRAYAEGKNILELLREEPGTNSEASIQLSYDVQAGTAIAALADPEHARYLDLYASEIAALLNRYQPRSLLEAGVGEATTLAAVLRHYSPRTVHGFDISTARLAKARSYLRAVTLVAASLEHIPYTDNSFDLVYTSHAIEPNGGREEPILRELYRVARRVLILLEPAYELALPEAQARMRQHGYCRDLAGIAERLGYRIVRHELFPVTKNPLNPTGLLLIDKHQAHR